MSSTARAWPRNSTRLLLLCPAGTYPRPRLDPRLHPSRKAVPTEGPKVARVNGLANQRLQVMCLISNALNGASSTHFTVQLKPPTSMPGTLVVDKCTAPSFIPYCEWTIGVTMGWVDTTNDPRNATREQGDWFVIAHHINCHSVFCFEILPCLLVLFFVRPQSRGAYAIC